MFALLLAVVMTDIGHAAKLASETRVSTLGPYTWTALIEGFHSAEEAIAACVDFNRRHPHYLPSNNCLYPPVGGHSDLNVRHSGVGWNWLEGSTEHFFYIGYYCRTGARYLPPASFEGGAQGRCVIVVDRFFDCSPCWIGNPISPLTGQKRQRVWLGDWLGDTFELVYDTRERLPTNVTGTTYQVTATGGFGPLWFGSHHRRVDALRSTTGLALAVHVGRGGNDVVSFRNDYATGRFVPHVAGGHQLRYEPSDNMWHFTDFDRNTLERFDARGQLRHVHRLDGTHLTLDYDYAEWDSPSYGQLVEVRDERGRSVRFVYERPPGQATPRVQRVTAPDGADTVLGYSADGRLTSLTRPGSLPIQYRYDDPQAPWALTSIVAEDSTVAARFTYDLAGRAVSSEHASGTERHAVSWDTPPQWNVVETYDPLHDVVWRDHHRQMPGGTVVQFPDGSSQTLEFALRGGLPALSARTQPAGSGSSPATLRLGHDAYGFLASRVDAQGMQTCWQRDASGRDTARIEGATSGDTCAALLTSSMLAPRTRTSTEWHPHWRLPTRVAEPGRLTTFIYHGQPDPLGGGTASCTSAAPLPGGLPLPLLCARIEQPTVNADGGLGFAAPAEPGSTPRVWRWQYNARGQPILSQDASGALTRSAYADVESSTHRVGDLVATTNALGHSTIYPRYDRAGQWLEAIDPNGVLTVNTYDTRQRLLSSTTAGAMTRYEYTARGALSRITDATGVTIDLVYDSAQRLVGISDAIGNRITYELTPSGNRASESVVDPAGTLRRQLTRAFDALGRVERQTGREIQP